MSLKLDKIKRKHLKAQNINDTDEVEEKSKRQKRKHEEAIIEEVHIPNFSALVSKKRKVKHSKQSEEHEPIINNKKEKKGNKKNKNKTNKVQFDVEYSPIRTKVFEKTPIRKKASTITNKLTKTSLFNQSDEEISGESFTTADTKPIFNPINIWHESDLHDAFNTVGRKGKKKLKNSIKFNEKLGTFYKVKIPRKKDKVDVVYDEIKTDKDGCENFGEFYLRHGRKKNKFPITDSTDEMSYLKIKSPNYRKSELASIKFVKDFNNIDKPDKKVESTLPKTNIPQNNLLSNSNIELESDPIVENQLQNEKCISDKVESEQICNDESENKEENHSSYFEESQSKYNIGEDYVLIIPQNTTIYLQGLVSLYVLEGNVEVNGYILNRDVKYEMFSPRGTSHLYLKNVWFQQSKSTNLSDESIKLLEEIKLKYTDVNKNDAICICKPLTSKAMDFIEKHISQKLFPPNESRYIIQESIKNGNPLMPSHEWTQMFKGVRLTDGNFEKILLCGGKGVGKSTLLRYACNSFLKDYEEVLVIDLDPGQPEFTIPSCLSATIVKKPLFGPNYSHLQTPVHSYFLGTVNVAQNPTLYLKCVKALVDSCKDLAPMPILINCMGFTRGLGLEIMVSILNIIQPHRVIEIYGQVQKNFAEMLDYSFIKTRNELFGYKSNLTPYALFRVKTMSNSNKGWELQPRQVREMLILSYFSQVLPDGVLSITDKNVPLYETNIKSIENFSDPNVIAVALGQLIALCSLFQDGIFKCFGFGILRGLDLENSKFAVITPIKLDNYEEINYVHTGSVTLPPSLYMTEDDNLGMMPYIQPGSLSGFTQPSKRAYVAVKKTFNGSNDV